MAKLPVQGGIDRPIRLRRNNPQLKNTTGKGKPVGSANVPVGLVERQAKWLVVEVKVQLLGGTFMLAKLCNPVILPLLPAIEPLPTDVEREENEAGSEHTEEAIEGGLHSRSMANECHS